MVLYIFYTYVFVFSFFSFLIFLKCLYFPSHYTRLVSITYIWFSYNRKPRKKKFYKNNYILYISKIQLNETSYESTLTILQVDQYDYGDYVCTASNTLGWTTSVNRLTVFSHPDPPFNFRSINSTHNSATLTWSAGFDGGKNRYYIFGNIFIVMNKLENNIITY